jgi:hypothetical protein
MNVPESRYVRASGRRRSSFRGRRGDGCLAGHGFRMGQWQAHRIGSGSPKPPVERRGRVSWDEPGRVRLVHLRGRLNYPASAVPAFRARLATVVAGGEVAPDRGARARGRARDA